MYYIYNFIYFHFFASCCPHDFKLGQAERAQTMKALAVCALAPVSPPSIFLRPKVSTIGLPSKRLTCAIVIFSLNKPLEANSKALHATAIRQRLVHLYPANVVLSGNRFWCLGVLWCRRSGANHLRLDRMVVLVHATDEGSAANR